MKSAGKPHRPTRGKIISLALIAIGVAMGLYVEHSSSIRPSTDDATIDADVIHVAAAVGGRIIELAATENAKVSKGDLLFRIDPEPYRLAVEQAEAELGIVVGTLDTRRRTIATDKSNATIASEQIKRAQTNLELATRTVEKASAPCGQGLRADPAIRSSSNGAA
jgi:membrane fusion protein, multidrug efflux system